MERKIRIRGRQLTAEAELNESRTASLIWEALPIEGQANLWGEEIYFSIQVKAAPDAGAREEVSPGELGYWPPGSAFCIFFGPTPASRGNDIRAASPVNIIGQVLSDAKAFLSVKSGEALIIEKA
jgi:uncharacterized protein